MKQITCLDLINLVLNVHIKYSQKKETNIIWHRQSACFVWIINIEAFKCSHFTFILDRVFLVASE